MNRDIGSFLEERGQFARLLDEYQKSYDFGLQYDTTGRTEDRSALLGELDALEADRRSQAARLDSTVDGQLERLRSITALVDERESTLNKKKLGKAKEDLRAQRRRSGRTYASSGLQAQIQRTLSSIERIRRSKLPVSIAKAADFFNLRKRAYADIASNRKQLDDKLAAATRELEEDRTSGQAAIDAASVSRVVALQARKAQMDARRNAMRDEYTTSLQKLLLDGLEQTFVGDTIYVNAEVQLAGYIATYSDGYEASDNFDIFVVGVMNQHASAQDDGTLHTFLSQILPKGVYGNGTIMLPVALSRYFAKPFCLSYYSEYVEGVYPLFSNYALQMMRLFGAEVVSTYLVDCSNVGGKYAEFSTYESVDEDDRVCIVRTAEELTTVLRELEGYVIESASTYLKDIYSSVEDYNSASAMKREIRVLFISSLSELRNEDIATLTTIARNGCRCGVFVFIGVSTDEFQASGIITQQHATAVNNLAALCDRIYMDSQGNLGFGNGSPAFHAPPAIGVSKAATIVEQAVRNSSKQTVIPLENHLPQGSDILAGDCRKRLVVPIGRTPQGDEYALDFHKDAAYMLMGGNPSAGKSSLLHTIILQCITRYKPEDLEIYIADFKDGSEFDVYANAGVKSVQAVLDDAEEDLATSFLTFVTKEVERRLACFKDLSDKTGTSVRNIEEFYEVNNGAGGMVRKIPRMLLIIDEFQSLYTGNRSTGELTNWLVRMGRTAGVFLIMSSQRSQADSNAMSSSFGGQTKEYFIYRLMFKLPYSGAKEIMSDRCSDTGRENPALRKAQTLKPGQAIVNPNMGATEEDNQLIQCYYPSSGIIDAISKLMAREQGRNEDSIILASEKPVDSARRPESSRIVLGESNRFHADGANDDDAFSDDTYVTLEPEVGAMCVYGITEQAFASALQSCWIALSNIHGNAACLALGRGKGAQALEGAMNGLVLTSDEDKFASIVNEEHDRGRFVLACIVNPYEYPSICRDSIGRSGGNVEQIEKLIRSDDVFLLICAENTKKVKEKVAWCDSDIPHRVLLAGNPASIRLAMTSDAGDKIKDGQFNVIRSNVLKAYYYNRDTNKLGRMRMYPATMHSAAPSIGEVITAEIGTDPNTSQERADDYSEEGTSDGYMGLTGN